MEEEKVSEHKDTSEEILSEREKKCFENVNGLSVAHGIISEVLI